MTDFKGIKDYFAKLNNKFASEIIKSIFDLEKNFKLINNIDNFIKTFADLENFSKKIKGKAQNFNIFLEDLKGSIFLIKLDPQKKIYELKSIKTNGKEIIDSYNQFILEKSFFALSHSSLKKEIYDELKNILEINNYFKKYISLLNNKRNILYATKDEIVLKKRNNEIVEIVENKSIQDLIKLLREEEEIEEQILIGFYKVDQYIRLFSSFQLHRIYQLIKENEYDEIRNFISPYVNNMINYYEPSEKININSINAPFKEKLEKISEYFNKIINYNLDYDEIFSKNKIKEKYKNGYKSHIIYIKSFNDDEFESYCLDIFFTITGNLPLFSNIFIFDEETKKEEYLPFLYKVRKTKINCLFIMILKKCKNDNEDNVLYEINELFKTEKNNNSIFILLYSKDNINKIEKYINSYEKFEYESNKECKEEIKKIFKNKISLVYSDLSGSGKTTYIKNLIKENNNYIYFPINEHLNIKSLTAQLKKEIKIDENKNNIIHFDLYDSIDENIIKEFFFNFFLFKYYGKDNYIFNYGFIEDKVQIIIELQNTYKNYLDKYKILNYLSIQKLITLTEIDDVPSLKEMKKVEKIEDSGIQIVSGVLSLVKQNKIGEENLPLYSKELMEQNQCEKIINEILIKYLKGKKYNYYQKINFIKLISAEFKNFSRCHSLSPSTVFENGVPSYFQSLRKNIIKSFIKNSKYIIELNYLEKEFYDANDKVLKESDRENNFETISSKLILEKNSQMKDIDKLNPSLICMHNNENFLSIISSNFSCEILKAIKIYINNIKTKYKTIIDYVKNPTELEQDLDKKKLSHELLKIIIDENFKGDGEYKKINDALEYNFKDFVFTKDNFIKMVLIYLRIKAGISTIIMGETGCGKTYLVKMFSLIFGQNAKSLYTLKFHSGITEKEIIDFIQIKIREIYEDEEKLIQELNLSFESDKDKILNSFQKRDSTKYSNLWFFKKFFFTFTFEETFNKYNEDVKKDIENRIKNRKIIIFFDEINTSNSLGTVKRIICDETFRKKINIPDRFVIICACNPYRTLRESNQKLQFGLSLRNKKKRKLVYTVNPLPYSMFNFVLYFNNLSKETTNKYIQKMNDNIICEVSLKNRQLINELVSKSHFFIIEKGDISSVSLREINRFGKFFSFFFEKYFKIYKKLITEPKKLEISFII